MSEKLDDVLIFETIALDYPIKDGEGNKVSELKMRRAKAKDMRRAANGKTDAEQELLLFSILVGLVPEDIEELDIVDYTKLQTAFTKMLSGKSA